MLFLRASSLIFLLGLCACIEANAGDHCNSIRKNKYTCDELDGPKLEGVKQKCEALLKKQKEARSLATASCGSEAKSVAGKSQCLATAGNQREMDHCNATADESLRKNAGDAASGQEKAEAGIRKARKELEEEIKKLKDDPDVDQEKLAKAENITRESRDNIESDVTNLASADRAAADGFGDVGGQGLGNASDLGTAQAGDASAGLAGSGDAGSVAASDSATSPTPSGGSLALSSSADSSSAMGSGAQDFSVPGFASQQASGAQAPLAMATGSGVAASPVTPSPGNAAAVAGVNLAAANVTRAPAGSAQEIARAAPDDALTLGASSSGAGAVRANVASASPVDAAPANVGANGVRDELLKRMLSASQRSASMTDASNEETSAGTVRTGGENFAYAGARAPASTQNGAEGESSGSSGEALSPFTSSLGVPHFSLLGSETEASVKKMVGELSKVSGPGEQSSGDEIGDRNGPTLFARSHATIERSLRKGRIRGVAMR